MENSKVFLTKIKNDINDGKYDEYLTLPFMTKNLLISAIEGKIQRRIEANGTPILTDAEIKRTIDAAKETAGMTFYLFQKHGFLTPTNDGKWELSDKGKLALKIALRT